MRFYWSQKKDQAGKCGGVGPRYSQIFSHSWEGPRAGDTSWSGLEGTSPDSQLSLVLHTPPPLSRRSWSHTQHWIKLYPLSICPRVDNHIMSVSNGKMESSLVHEILSHLGLANKTAAWGTLGTLRPFLSFNVDKDVQRLLEAIAGQGVDQGTIVDVLTNRNGEQRQLIARAFQDRTQQDLLKSLQAALSGSLEKVVVALLKSTAQYDAHELRAALKDINSAEDVGVEILSTRSPPQLKECLTVYKHDFQVEIEDDMRSETSGLLRDLLLALAKGTRESYSGIKDYNLAEQDAHALHEAGETGTGATWIMIFTQRNTEHLNRVFDEYQRQNGQEIEEGIRNCFPGSAQKALLTLASVIRNTPLYFAEKLHLALQGTEPNHQVLMRILISRSETDLLSIRAEFKKKFGKSLYSSLQEAMRGDSRSALLALCRAEDM
ncbi:annexin A9 isoform X1 [Monodelphis domestica]|nr:annexin A9 isoform X1 [Monodelphis domestica]